MKLKTLSITALAVLSLSLLSCSKEKNASNKETLNQLVQGEEWYFFKGWEDDDTKEYPASLCEQNRFFQFYSDGRFVEKSFYGDRKKCEQGSYVTMSYSLEGNLIHTEESDYTLRIVEIDKKHLVLEHIQEGEYYYFVNEKPETAVFIPNE